MEHISRYGQKGSRKKGWWGEGKDTLHFSRSAFPAAHVLGTCTVLPSLNLNLKASRSETRKIQLTCCRHDLIEWNGVEIPFSPFRFFSCLFIPEDKAGNSTLPSRPRYPRSSYLVLRFLLETVLPTFCLLSLN